MFDLSAPCTPNLAPGELFRSFRYFDAAGWIRVGPAKRAGRAGIRADVLHRLPREIGDGRERAACDDVTLDFGEPDLGLVEPRAVSGREVETNARITFEELSGGCIAGGEIVQPDVDFVRCGRAFDQLIEESNEFVAGVPFRGLARTFPVYTSSAA